MPIFNEKIINDLFCELISVIFLNEVNIHLLGSFISIYVLTIRKKKSKA